MIKTVAGCKWQVARKTGFKGSSPQANPPGRRGFEGPGKILDFGIGILD
jgi:hypothetical protein